MGKEAVEHAREIEIQAEIKMGEFLKKMERHKGGTPKKKKNLTPSPEEGVKPATYKEIGVSYKEASDIQKEVYMGQKKIIVILGIIAVILLSFHAEKAIGSTYTTGGVACLLLSDFEAAADFLHQGDREAVNQMVKQGKCIWLKPNVEVYVTYPEWSEYAAQIHWPGSTVTLWTHRQNLRRGVDTPVVQPNPVTVHEWFVLKSFLWIEPGKTKKQEIIQKYGKPTSQDEDSILYKANQNPDFKEWKTIKFILNTSGVIEGIRAEK